MYEPERPSIEHPVRICKAALWKQLESGPLLLYGLEGDRNYLASRKRVTLTKCLLFERIEIRRKLKILGHAFVAAGPLRQARTGLNFES
jgi:hypothetical protein